MAKFFSEIDDKFSTSCRKPSPSEFLINSVTYISIKVLCAIRMSCSKTYTSHLLKWLGMDHRKLITISIPNFPSITCMKLQYQLLILHWLNVLDWLNSNLVIWFYFVLIPTIWAFIKVTSFALIAMKSCVVTVPMAYVTLDEFKFVLVVY